MKTSTAPLVPTVWKCGDGTSLPITQMTDAKIAEAMSLLTGLVNSGSGWKKPIMAMFNALRDEQIRRKVG